MSENGDLVVNFGLTVGPSDGVYSGDRDVVWTKSKKKFIYNTKNACPFTSVHYSFVSGIGKMKRNTGKCKGSWISITYPFKIEPCVCNLTLFGVKK